MNQEHRSTIFDLRMGVFVRKSTGGISGQIPQLFGDIRCFSVFDSSFFKSVLNHSQK